MPRKKVEAKPVSHNGRNCWRVIVPRELNGGKQGRRYFADDRDGKKTALAFAADLESERRSAHARFLALPVDVQNMAMHALDILGDRRIELVDAAKLYLAQNAREQRTLTQAIDECLDRKAKAKRRHRSIVGLGNALRRFAKGRESKLVREVTQQECENWINSPEAKAMATRRSRQIDLGTFFSFCVKRGYCAKRPVDGLEKYSHGKSSPKILTVSQCESVLKAAIAEHDGDLLATVALQLFGGLRPYESYRIAREMIKGGELRIDETITKTLDIRIVNINPTLKAWLAFAWKIGSKLPASDAPRRMTAVRMASGVQPWPHDCLRHSFVSYRCAVAGIKTTAQEAAHSEDTLLRHYRALVTTEEARKFWELRP
jgi:hypothetical protein